MAINRSQKRRIDKKIKSKMTNEQYENFYKQCHFEAVNMEVDRQMGIIIKDMTESIVEVLKANRISDARCSKILDEFAAKVKSKHESRCKEDASKGLS